MANLFVRDANVCYNLVDFLGYLVYLCICVGLMWLSLHINNAIELKQTQELGNIDVYAYRPSAFLSLELETFWDRFSWFQLLIASLIVSSLSSMFTVFVTYYYRDTYNSVDSCQLVYPLIYNPTEPDSIQPKYHALAATVVGLNYLMTDFLPYLFLLRIIEVSLVKQREADGEESVRHPVRQA